MKYLDWLKTNPEKGYYWVRPYDCYEERIDEFTDWYDNAGNVETKFTEQPDEVISDRLTYIDYLEMIGHCGAYKTANEVLKEENAQLKKYEQIVTSYNMKPIDYEIACETVNKLLDEKKALKEENTKLKELLKECRDEIEYLRKHYKGNIEHFKNNTRLDKEINRALIEKIDEVLK